MNEATFCYKYPHPAVTADCVIFGFDGAQLKVLLVRRGGEPFKGKWAFPGGFMNMNESIEECALRELREETGLKEAFMEQFRVFSKPDRDPRERVVTVAFLALIRLQEVQGGDDADEAQWFALDDVPALAFDHDYILREAQRTLREKIHFEPIGFELLPEKFTMKQLQTLYESIVGVNFDRRNFSKKMFHLDLLTELDEVVWPTTRRAAKLYSFNEAKYAELKKKGFRIEF